jgi:PAS domain S-box-containing protein
VSQTCKILIVNDRAEDRQLYRHYLLADPEFSCDILEEPSAEAALETCRSQLLDSILLKFQLPDSDGLTFLSNLKRQTAGDPPSVVILADDDNTAAAVKAIKSGAEDYLVKQQTTPDQLRLAVRSAIENVKLRRALKHSEAERDRIRSQLQDSQYYIQQVAETIPGMLYVYDLIEQRNVYVNRQVEELLGYSEQQIQDMGEALLPRLLHPDDLVTVSTRLAQLQATQDGEALETECRMQHANGEWRWLSCREMVYRRLADGTPHQILGIAQNITDRKRAELALAAFKERLELAQQASNIGSFDIDFSSGRIVWDRQQEALYGMAPGSYSGTIAAWQARIHPDDLNRIEHDQQQLWANRTETWCREYRILRADTGELRWLESRGRIFYNAEGHPIRALGTNIDITERKQAEAKLQASQHFIQSITDTSPGLIYLYDLIDQRNIYLNSQSFNLLGYSPEAILDMGERFMQQHMHPDDLARMANYFRELSQTEDGKTREFEYRMRHADGEWRWFLSQDTIFSRTANGEPHQILGIAQDITARKQTEAALQQSETRFRRLMDCNLIGVMFWHTDGTIFDANDRFLQIIGYSREDLQAGRLNWRQLTPSEQIHLSDQSLTKMRQGISDFIEKDYIHKAGHRVPVMLNGIMFADSQERGISFVLDLSERKRAEAERLELLEREQAARAAAEEANRTKDDFLAVVSHELRAPLNSILGWAKLLQSRALDAATTERALETIARNARSQSQLIEDLLDISRITQGNLRLNLTQVDLAAVVEAAIDVVRPVAAFKQIELHSHLDPVEPILGDFDRLQQVVWNLLSNALKFTPEAGRVKVELEQVERDRSERDRGERDRGELLTASSYIQLTITDTGKGIAAEFLPHVFDRFQQADRTSRSQDGLGLGLTIARQLVELHGGMIAAASEGEGKGATFTVKLPVSQLPEQSPADTEADSTSLTAIRILLVDDDSDGAEFLSIVLQQQGAIVATARSAQQAYDQFIQFQPDLLITDICMPREDGYSLLQRVRKLTAEQGKLIPAIALTAYLSETDVQTIYASGFQLHLPKPVDVTHLTSAIQQILKQRSTVKGAVKSEGNNSDDTGN